MNKGIYRLVWNNSLGALQVVGEAAKSKNCGGSGARGAGPRTSLASSKVLAWPLALLSLGIAASICAAPYDVTTGADSGAGSLREAMLSSGAVYIDPAVSTITLSSGVALYAGPVTLATQAPLAITGPGLIGNGNSLGLEGASNGLLSTTITGQFNGSVGFGGITQAGTSGADNTVASGLSGYHNSSSAGSAAISG